MQFTNLKNKLLYKRHNFLKVSLFVLLFIIMFFYQSKARVIYNLGYGLGLGVYNGNPSHLWGLLAIEKPERIDNQHMYDYYRFDIDFEHFVNKPRNVSLITEPFIAYVSRPTNGLSFGATELLRYYFIKHSSFGAFLNPGFGISYNTLKYPGQASKYLFVGELGIGVDFRISKKHSMFIEDRFIHMSNGFLRTPNGAVDSDFISVGFTF